MRAKVKGIDNAQAARDRDIEFLNKKIEEAIGLISAGRDTNAELRDANTNFQSEIKELYQTEGELNASLEDAATETGSQSVRNGIADRQPRRTLGRRAALPGRLARGRPRPGGPPEGNRRGEGKG